MPKMTSPPTGVKVRMYRQGHGDCFLLAFAGRQGRSKKNVYVLIDCGLKPGSEVDNHRIEEIVDDIHEATGGVVDIVIVTHEHQDHVNGFTKKKSGTPIFNKINFKKCWLAWTEDDTDDVANALRDRFRDTLLTLAFAQKKVSKYGAQDLKNRLSDLLGTEIGAENHPVGDEGTEIIQTFCAEKAKAPLASSSVLASSSIKGISNKKAMKYLRDQAENPVEFLRPNSEPKKLPNVRDLKVYALGPPRNKALLLDLDPEGNEEFYLAPSGSPMALNGAALGMAFAVLPEMTDGADMQPFSQRYRIAKEKIFAHKPKLHPPNSWSPFKRNLNHLRRAYGCKNAARSKKNVAWRRIDEDWLGSVEGIALRLNKEVNNTSLVLAFELPKTGKVLLFTGDAQRGSWIGWSELEWKDVSGKKTTARDLLGRCVLYKVGHHGSHNATLIGTEADDYANIGWMARGAFAEDFVAMIPANTPWALGKPKPWTHPLPQIEEALMEKARGRVFRSDRDHIEQPDTSVMTQKEWDNFQKRVDEHALYFDYAIEDRW